MKLIIQIPCLNEEQSLPATLRDLPRKIEGIDAIEILVIDDGSSDRTAQVAEEQGAHHIVRFTKQCGLARAFSAGLDAGLKAGADIIVNTDADGQYKGEDIPRLVQPILKGEADVVIGNRDIENVRQFSSLKKRLQRLGSWVVRNLSGTTVPDATTGFRAYSREAAFRMNIVSTYTYTLESLIQAQHKNLAVANITIHPNDVTRESRLFKSMWQYIARSMVTILRIYAMYNPLKTFVVAGYGLSLAGFLIGCRFLYFYLLGYGGGHTQSLILAAIFLIIGFQMFIVGIVGDLIAANRRLIEDTLYRVRKIESITRP